MMTQVGPPLLRRIQARLHPKLTKARMVSKEPKSNWGRWSDDDELGTANLITPAKVVDAAGLVTTGRVVNLGRIIRHDTVRVADRPAPIYVLTVDGGDYAAGARDVGGAYSADDMLCMPTSTGTHVDGLAHVWSSDGLYNGHSPNLVRSRGAKVCGIEKVGGIVTRGVLCDICAIKGVAALPPSYEITAADLDEATAGLSRGVEPGDALLIRTGWLSDKTANEDDMRALVYDEPGLGREAATWIAERDVAVLGCDNLGIELLPEADREEYMPVHVALLNKLGMYLIEAIDLDELARSERLEFMFMMAPLRIRGGVGSPLNPLAVL